MEYLYPNARAAMKGYCDSFSVGFLAHCFEVDDAHIYRARKGDITPTLKRALQRKGIIPPDKKRVRFAADVSRQLRDDICDESRRLELTNGEMLKMLWLAYLALCDNP